MTRGKHDRKAGFALLWVFALAAMLAIGLYIEAPRVVFEAQRNKEQLLIDRGEQYKRAIQLFTRKFGRYPARIEELENTNNFRFLRRRYKDPMTGSDEWRIIHAGPGGFTDSLTRMPPKPKKEGETTDSGTPEEEVQLNPGLQFHASDRGPRGTGAPGQSAADELPYSSVANYPEAPPDQGAETASLQPGGVLGQPAQEPGAAGAQSGEAPPQPQPGQPGGGPQPVFTQTPGAVPRPGFQGDGQQPGTETPMGVTPPGAMLGQSPEQQGSGQFAGSRPPMPIPPPQQPGAIPNAPQPGFVSSSQTPGQNPAVDLINRGLRGEGLRRPGAAGNTVLGAGIAGVASTSKQKGIKTYKKRSKYNEWEFIYDQTEDMTSPFGQRPGVGGAVPPPSFQGGPSPVPSGPKTGK